MEKTIKQIVEENQGKEIHIMDYLGVFGELPMTDENLKGYPDAISIHDDVVIIYVC